MNRFFGFACAMLLFGSFAAWAAPPTMLKESSVQRQREATASAYVWHCSHNEFTGLQRCRGFNIHATSNSLGEYEETQVRVYQTIYEPNRWAWREVSCPVTEAALQVKSQKSAYAEVDVSFDSEGPGCYGYGYSQTYDPDLGEWTYSDWSYFGMVTVQAQLLSPRWEDKFEHTGKTTQKDNVSGTSYEYRQSCKGGSANSMLGGGFTLYGDDILELYFPFDGVQTDGNFWYNKCTRMNK